MLENHGVIEFSEDSEFDFQILWKIEPIPYDIDTDRLDNLIEIALAQSPPYSLAKHASVMKLLVPNASNEWNKSLTFELRVLSKSVEDCRVVYFKLITRLVSGQTGLNWNPFGHFVTRLRILDEDGRDLAIAVQKDSTGFLPAVVLEFKLPGLSCLNFRRTKRLNLEVSFKPMHIFSQTPSPEEEIPPVLPEKDTLPKGQDG